MAGVHVAAVLLPPSLRRRWMTGRCYSAGGGGGDRRRDETQWFLKAAVSGVTELLRIFPVPSRQQSPVGDCPAEEADFLVRDLEDVVSILRSDFDRAYFLTGNFTSKIYAENCLFEDPTIKFYGRDKYSQNLDLLIPFFEGQSLVLENIEKVLDSKKDIIIATWKLRTFLRLPWRPLISIGGKTAYEIDENFKIVRHTESWDVSALQAVGQIFLPSSASD
ncbi:adenine phosphoribosyltransferase-like protein, putative (DUF2358) [Wolffia australiana]